MKYGVLVFLLLFAAAPLAAQQSSGIRPPRLENREQILRERNLAAQRLLAPGDSVLVRVFALIDENGTARDLEIKDEVAPEVKAAALDLVRRMRFIPAQSAGKPKATLLKIPVKFVRPREK